MEDKALLVLFLVDTVESQDLSKGALYLMNHQEVLFWSTSKQGR